MAQTQDDPTTTAAPTATPRPARRTPSAVGPTPLGPTRTPGPVPDPALVSGQRRAVVEGIDPIVDGGRFPIKRVVGDEVVVEADCFTDGHDAVVADLLHRAPGSSAWTRVAMAPLGNDRWRAAFRVDTLGRYAYTVAARADRFETWRRDLEKRVAAGQDIAVDLRIGAELVTAAADRAADAGAADDAATLRDLATRLAGGASPPSAARQKALATEATRPATVALLAAHPDRSLETRFEHELEVVVDPVDARFAAWYELFPRSASPDPARHGTFRDVIARLPYVAGMGFDVLYLPPIHPIGRTFRKGPNNVTTSGPDDPGVPWAIGGPEGGHTAIHPELGTLDDFRALVAAAREHRLELALDIAFQASPDHPFVREHPSWFRQRPDGSVQYAENPPKKYQDIYPFDFETPDWQAQWSGLRDVVAYWIEQGVRVFRVDNPHTKPFGFWEWLIGDIKARHPDVLFLAEAFTRPKVMGRLAKLGFSQSYTYFTWRTTKQELTEYFTQLSTPPSIDTFRPNVWPNTPDILHETLQLGGRPGSALRFLLAATLSPLYGIYGPVFELALVTPREPGSEEYLDSEKYQRRTWTLDAQDSLAPLITRVNAIRRAHPALQSLERLAFHETENDQLLGYSKVSADGADHIVAVVNLDPHGVQAGMLTLPLERFGIDPTQPYDVHDLLSGATYRWSGPRNYVELDPAVTPGHVLELRQRVRTEAAFPTY